MRRATADEVEVEMGVQAWYVSFRSVTEAAAPLIGLYWATPERFLDPGLWLRIGDLEVRLIPVPSRTPTRPPQQESEGDA